MYSKDLSEYSEDQVKTIQKAINNNKTILLSANWGVGKTYFVNSLIHHKYKDKRVRYVSLFGIESFDRLVQQVMKPIINLEKSTLSVFDKELPLSELNNFLNGGSHLLIEQIENEIIILDDLERNHIDNSLVLGLIDTLKKKNSIIFICNRNKIEEEDFTEQLEKVSDKIVDNLIIDFRQVMKNNFTEERVEKEVSFSFYLMKENSLRTAVKVRELISLLGEYSDDLNYKDIRLFTALAIEKLRKGYLNKFYDEISYNHTMPLDIYKFKNKKIKIDDQLKKEYQIKQDYIIVKDEKSKDELSDFVKFLNKIQDEDFYHVRKSVLNLLRYEYFDSRAFAREVTSKHPVYMKGKIPFQVTQVNDLFENTTEVTLVKIKAMIFNVLKFRDNYMSEDSFIDFKVFFNLIHSYGRICEVLTIDNRLNKQVLLNDFINRIKELSTKDLSNLKATMVTSTVGVCKDISTEISKEIKARKYKEFREILETDDDVAFYTNSYNERLFDSLTPELLKIVAFKYVKGSRLAKDIVKIIKKDSYYGTKREKRDKICISLKSLFVSYKEQEKDSIVKARLNKIINDKSFNKIALHKETKIKPIKNWVQNNTKVDDKQYKEALIKLNDTSEDSLERAKADMTVLSWQMDKLTPEEDRIDISMDSGPAKIKKLEKDDFEDVKKFFIKNGRGYEFIHKEIEKSLDDKSSYGAYVGKEIVGCIIVKKGTLSEMNMGNLENAKSILFLEKDKENADHNLRSKLLTKVMNISKNLVSLVQKEDKIKISMFENSNFTNFKEVEVNSKKYDLLLYRLE